MPDHMSVVLLTGTVATGKTRIAAEIAEILPPERSIACVDLDQLGWGFLPGVSADRILRLRIDNLAAIWPNLRSAGFRHVVISGAVSTPEELRLIREAIEPSDLTVVRLKTSPSLLESRLASRDGGRLFDAHLAIMPVLERSLDGANMQDVSVMNDARPARRVAMEVLEKVGWT